MKRALIFCAATLGLAGCATQRSGDCCATESVGQTGGVPVGAVATSGRSRGVGVKAVRKGETVTDLTQESRVLGVEAVVGGDAEIRR